MKVCIDTWQFLLKLGQLDHAVRLDADFKWTILFCNAQSSNMPLE